MAPYLRTSALHNPTTAATPPFDESEALPATLPPQRYGLLIYPGFESLDLFGPLEVLQTLARTHKLDLYLIAPSLAPVSTLPNHPKYNPFDSSFGVEIVPTHSYATAPWDIDVLLVPGGLGSRDPARSDTVEFIRERFPHVKYLITVCTGALLCAKAGVLDGRMATTNKKAFRWIKEEYPNVKWVAKARWVVDGNVWTTAGVSAGTDGVLAFVGQLYGEEMADGVAEWMEWERVFDSRHDPFATLSGLDEMDDLLEEPCNMSKGAPKCDQMAHL